ncbi:RhuM family protein [Hyphomicrobium sp. CS1BSMeth3]|uniref:RhuM family protein n=1 Tax=Hyphomicrobium sp. CS1BSMeth3 TaxID=1892844 RepID=UPI0009315879|nr:RhuM family protein [Hyphomicrobium sp. CS1BSMeth3]
MPSRTAPGTNVAVFTVDGTFSLDVRVEADTLWLTQHQIAALFATSAPNITMHLRNVFREREVSPKRTTKEFLVVRTEGRRQVQRTIPHYNLDAILSVGYRINSKRGTQFRIWASGVLRDHLLKGYSLDAQRLEARGTAELRATIDLLATTLSQEGLIEGEGQAILDVIQHYARSWSLLLAYDEDALRAPTPSSRRPLPLSPTAARRAISTLKRDLLDKGDATDLFGLERGPQLDAIIEGLAQTFDGQALYPSAEIRAAHLLYFVIKDHPFADGNKRIGSFLFVSYLARHGLHGRITDTALVALALLTAQSAPKQKDLIIRLIMNLIS